MATINGNSPVYRQMLYDTAGNDVMTGGGGSHTFSITGGRDTITDLSQYDTLNVNLYCMVMLLLLWLPIGLLRSIRAMMVTSL